MAKNSGVIRLVLDLYRQGYTIVAIAKTLNLNIEEVVNVINEYS